MKKLKFKNGFFLALSAFVIYFPGAEWTLPEIHEAEGVLVLPFLNISFRGIARKEVVVVLESQNSRSFQVPQTQVSYLLRDVDELAIESKPHARARIIFQKNIWGQIVNPYLVLTSPGWIRRPK